MIRENITLNRVQECKVDIEKRSCGRTSRGEKKSGCQDKDYGVWKGKIGRVG